MAGAKTGRPAASQSNRLGTQAGPWPPQCIGEPASRPWKYSVSVLPTLGTPISRLAYCPEANQEIGVPRKEQHAQRASARALDYRYLFRRQPVQRVHQLVDLLVRRGDLAPQQFPFVLRRRLRQLLVQCQHRPLIAGIFNPPSRGVPRSGGGCMASDACPKCIHPLALRATPLKGGPKNAAAPSV